MSKVLALGVSALFAALLLPAEARAERTLIIDDNLDVLPAGYALVTSASENATASIRIGDVGGSNGLVFDGSWDTPASGRESAAGILAPVIPTVDDFQLDPADIDGIASIEWMVDLEVISNTMVPPDQGIFAQLVVYQLQPDFNILTFLDGGFFIQVGESRTITVTAVASDFGQPGARPDFSPSGLPVSFGLLLGAAYPREIQPVPLFVDGTMFADNWKVEVIGGAGDLFKNGFEPEAGVSPTSSLQALEAVSAGADCNCSVPLDIPELEALRVAPVRSR